MGKIKCREYSRLEAAKAARKSVSRDFEHERIFRELKIEMSRMRESARGAKVAFATKNNFAGIVDDWFPISPKLVLVVRGGPLANCSDWPRHELVEKLKLLFLFAAKTRALVLVSGDRFDIDAQLTRLNSKFAQNVSFLAVLDESDEQRDSNLTHALICAAKNDVRSCLEAHWPACPTLNVLLAADDGALELLERVLSNATPVLLNPLEARLRALATAVRKRSKRALNSSQGRFYDSFSKSIILLENDFERKIAQLPLAPIVVFSLVSHNESVCAEFLENCPIDDYNAISGSSALLERVVDALLGGEICFVRLVCRQFQNLRISPSKLGETRTLERLFGADAAADPVQFIHERKIRFWLLKHFVQIQGFNFDKSPLNLQSDDFFHLIFVWSLLNSQREVAALCLARVRRNLLPNAAVAAHVLQCPVALEILGSALAQLSGSELEQLLNFECAQWGAVRFAQLLSPLQNEKLGQIIQAHISSRWYGALRPLRKKRNWTVFVFCLFCPIFAAKAIKQEKSLRSSVSTFLSVPFVHHIYGTIFYILLLTLYALVLLQNFSPAPAPQEFAVYAAQGFHFGASVFAVVRDWRRAREFLWHRSLVNLSTGLSWILLTFAIVMRSLSSNDNNVLSLQLSDDLYTGLLIFALSFLFTLPKFFQRFCVNKTVAHVAAMIWHSSKFLCWNIVFLVLLVVSFGITTQSLLFPNEPRGEFLFRGIVSRPFSALFLQSNDQLFQLESQYDFEDCGNFSVSEISALDERCMRTHLLVPVLTIAFLFYAFSWIFFTLKALLEQPNLVPASWHSEILRSSIEEIQGRNPPLDSAQQREIQKLQANVSKMLSFKKLEQKLVDSGAEENDDSSKREMARLNEKISELSTNLEEMQYALEDSISSVGTVAAPVVKIRTPTPLPTPPPPTPPPVMTTTSAQTDPLPKPTREDCLEHMSLDDFPSDLEIYGMTRSTLNSRSRKVSSADADADRAAKKSSERITGEVTKEPKEQHSPPLFCVWGRSVENSSDSAPLIKDHFEEPTIVQRVSTVQSHITAIVKKSADKWRLSRSSLPGQKPKFPVPDDHLKWATEWHEYEPVVAGLATIEKTAPARNELLNKVGRTGATGLGRLEKLGANKVSYMLVVCGRRFLARGCTSNEHQLPFWIHKEGENRIDEIEKYLGTHFFVASSANTIDSIYNTDHAWLEGDFLISFVEEIDPKWELKEKFDLVWADSNVLRYFGRMEQKIIKFILQQRNLQEVVYNLPSRKK